MKQKEINFYSNILEEVAKLSHCKRAKVGALILDNQGKNIIAYGYNGTPSGRTNCCEENNVTKLEVIHAEMNAILKVARSNNSTENTIMFCTHSPCFECAKAIIQSKISKVYYKEIYNMESLLFLQECGIETFKIKTDV